MGDETFTCEICIQPTLLTQKFSHHTDCVHNICLMCIASHIQAKIDENISTIKCPELDCGKTLKPLEIEPMIPSILFVKWCDCLCKSSISMIKSSYCPNPRCSELILDECNEKTKKCTCPGCKTQFCYACKGPWHAGFWCSENGQERDVNDILFGILVERNKWTRCRGCGQPVERIDGCYRIRCRCGRQICYMCGSEIRFCRCGHNIAVFILMILMCTITFIILGFLIFKAAF